MPFYSYKNFLRIKKTKIDFSYLNIISKSSVIGPHFFGKLVRVYNGKKWYNVKVNKFMIGHKWGEFIKTRKFRLKKDKKKKKKKIIMSNYSYKNVLAKGLPVDKVIIFYRLLNFKNYYLKMFGFSLYFLNIIYRRLEYQYSSNSILFTNYLNNDLLLRVLNGIVLKYLPPFLLLRDLKKYILVKLILIKSYKGERIVSMRPMNGQRSWSNSKTTRKMNKDVRSFISDFKLGLKKLTFKQRKARLANYYKNKKDVKIKKQFIVKKRKTLWF